MAKTTEIPYKVTVDTTEANSSLDNLEQSFENIDGAAGGVIDQLKGVGLAMKAIATNPIGLVISGIAAIFATLSAAAKRNEKAMENINKVMAFFKGTLDGVLNALGPLVEFLTDKLLNAFENPIQTIKDLGNAILENIINRFKAITVLGDAITALFKGDFQEAGKLATDAFIQIGTGIENGTDKIVKAGEAIVEFGKSVKTNVDIAIDANKRLANSELELLRIQKAFEIQQLTFQQQAEQQRQIRDDESLSIQERIAANKELGAVLDRQLQTELALAQKQLEFAELKQAADGVTLETEAELLDARVKIAEINERIHSQRSEQLTNENALIKEQKELEQQKADEAIRLAEKEAKEKAKAEKKFKEEQIKAEEQLAAVKKSLVGQTFDLIGQIADEDSAVAKGAAVAQIGVNTFEGVSKALASSPPPFNFVAAGLVSAAGIAAGVKAAGIKIPKRKKSSVSDSASASTASAPSIPSFTENLTDDINTDTTAAAINNQSRQSVRAVVVLDDFEAAQSTRNMIDQNASV